MCDRYFCHFYYPTTWAATRRLRKIDLHLWMVDAVMQGAYMAEDSRHTTMQRITCVSATLNFAGLVQYATICLKMSPKNCCVRLFFQD